MAVTVRDIARAAGVSVGTVSRALKGQPGLTEATRAQVCAVAAELGYDLGRLRTRPLKRVLFLLHRQHSALSTNLFYSQVLQGAEEACRDAGMALSFLSLGPTDPVLEQVELHAPDALLCAGFFEPELLQLLRDTSCPLVLIDMWAEGLPSVNPDHRHGGCQATRHLLEQGRRHIAYLSGSPAHYSVRQRGLGYRQALYDAGILADPQLEVLVADGEALDQDAARAMRALLALPTPPDAVFAFNDAAALAALRACQELGVAVPGQVAIVGFDNLAAAAQASPALSSVAVDKPGLGRAGVARLLHPDDGPQDVVMPVQLVVRGSSA
ncbi:LacI family transcriptional regulator [Chitiniphilus shinanonensis]|uniref:LacI family transcriptional regulator n=1 Tax=Chitiniphilus shinanonensis TaxID=553088 RepID=A0ABQ6BYI3_9NEIS|nr:LacI family DNA-binding transcriptional regulator [Chitiniphilus shinanonensis]GLS06200.1 LacI family transcriptional regulator [Chitiniphilus shinanonensis]